MPVKLNGVNQTPITPLNPDFSLDLPTFERLVDFHVRTMGTSITWPYHKSESHALTLAERRLFAEAAVRVVAGRVPVYIHVSALAVEDSFELARHAQRIGADAIVGITPYFWNVSADAVYEYFVRLGTSTELPIIGYNSPTYMAGAEFTGELISRLIERLPNFVGMKEASFNSEKFIELSRAALALRPDFAFVTGVEYLLPSMPLGGVGSFSSAGAICPNLCRQLFEACVEADWARARELQSKVSRIWLLFRDQYPSSLKGGMVMMGRPVGPTRSPLPTATKERQEYIRAQLEELHILETEPHGW